jgi:hypothetical protein
MKVKWFLVSTISLLSCFLTGCSLFVSSHQTVSVQSPQSHAKVWVNGAYIGEAPIETSVRRDETLVVMVKKDGFETSTRVVQHHLSPTGTLDVIGACLFLLPGLGFCSGGAFSLDDTGFIIDLAPAHSQDAK